MQSFECCWCETAHCQSPIDTDLLTLLGLWQGLKHSER